MLSRVLMAKPSPAKAAPKLKPGPTPAAEYFAEEEATKSVSPAFSLGGLNIFASGGDAESRSQAWRVLKPLQWPVQAKLEIGAVEDPLEHEADRVAERVTRMPDPAVGPRLAVPGAALGVQRKCSCGGSCDKCKGEQSDEDHGRLQRKPEAAGISGHASAPSVAPPIVHEVLRSAGRPLDSAARAFMEPRFSYDFGTVRVHSDGPASASAKALAARAYTVGRDLVFAAGQFAPIPQLVVFFLLTNSHTLCNRAAGVVRVQTILYR